MLSRFFPIVAALALGSLVGSFFLRSTKAETHAPDLVLAPGNVAHVVTSVPITVSERQALGALAFRVSVVREEIAKIASGDAALAEKIFSVAQAVQAIDHDDEELRRAAAHERGLEVALVQSGSTWVPR